MRLIDTAHALLKKHLNPGDKAIDGTLGRGNDTLLLAQIVGPKGAVIGFDIQEEAIEATSALLHTHHCADWVQLFYKNHATLIETLPLGWDGHIATAIFNLGYLPRGNPEVITKTHTTLIALKSALSALKPSGLLICMLYPGHPGGDTEATTVKAWMQRLPSSLYTYQNQLGQPSQNPAKKSPELHWIIKL